MSTTPITPQTALPDTGVPATGQFTVAVNIKPNTFDDTNGQPTDAPYNETLIGSSSNKSCCSLTKFLVVDIFSLRFRFGLYPINNLCLKTILIFSSIFSIILL